jgi:hypothetical protein
VALLPCETGLPCTHAGQNDLSGEFHDGAGSSLREQLAAIPRVDHVSIDEEHRQIWLILSADGDAQAVEHDARGLSGEYTLRVAVQPERRDRQRVRFVDVHGDVLPDLHMRFTVTLEWGGTEYRGTATGEQGGALELRTIAAASLDAIVALAPADLQVRLAGVKQVRAFDADLIVVSLYRPDATPHNLVGVVVMGTDVRRAAAVAVLNALNRLLGNYLVLP